MTKIFNQETPTYKSDAMPTPYQRAQQEWDSRIGLARVQAKNWRIMAFLSMFIMLVLLILLITSLSLHRAQVYVAQVTEGGRVVNVAPLTLRYQPTQAQEEYFVSHVIELLRSVPLDPVVAKNNWTTAYQFLTQRAVAELNRYFQENNPVNLLGKKTVTVKIIDINAESDNTYHLDWEETITNMNGQVEGQPVYSGMFTVTIEPPKTQGAILQNPLGLYIVDFHISSREKGA
jgi:type IV secretion system protein VirB5